MEVEISTEVPAEETPVTEVEAPPVGDAASDGILAYAPVRRLWMRQRKGGGRRRRRWTRKCRSRLTKRQALELGEAKEAAALAQESVAQP